MSDVRGLITRHQNRIIEALPSGVKFDRVMSMAIAAARKNEALVTCDQASFLGALIQVAHLGLEPGITAHLVPFYNKRAKRMEVQFIPDYRGLMQLARRSGDITAIEAVCVYDGDIFEYRKGTTQSLSHQQTFQSEDDNDITHVWAMARFKNGDCQFEVMSIESIKKVRDMSKASDKGPWVTNFPEMAKKTVVRKLCKYLPSHTDLQAAVVADEAAELGLQQNIIDVQIDDVKEKTLADKVRDKNVAQLTPKGSEG